jgi:hypothetical protein
MSRSKTFAKAFAKKEGKKKEETRIINTRNCGWPKCERTVDMPRRWCWQHRQKRFFKQRTALRASWGEIVCKQHGENLYRCKRCKKWHCPVCEPFCLSYDF